MPTTSKQQFKFMQAIIHGSLKKSGLSKEKAKEFVQNVDYKSLPKFHKLNKMIKKKD